MTTRARARSKRLARRLRASARNALEVARFGRLGEEYGAPFDVVGRGPHHRLRRYVGAPPDAPVALLVPPLMLTADVYDISPDVSAVAMLLARGITPFVVDFGAPEREAGGMSRSLDDHVRAVVRAIRRTRELTGRPVHLLGYSQGGMFAYQAAAYLHGATSGGPGEPNPLASVVTFGSPVDLHKNLPAVRSDLTGALVRSVFPVVRAALDRLEGLPGMVTSTAFKVLSTRKELEQRLEFLRSVHDRERIIRREARRRFIKGAGFVAWPGPALRTFVEDFVVHNRMLSGGFVIDGRTVSLADLSCPILAFIGTTDEIARPSTIRAIEEAAPDAPVRFVMVHAGHFGLVVGSRARERTWPTVADWIFALERGVPASEALAPERPAADDDLDPGGIELDVDLVLELLGRGARDAWIRLGDAFTAVNDAAEVLRWREPRLRRLARIGPDTRVSASRELSLRARETPDATFFLWRGRAFSYAEADARVTSVARALSAQGVRRGERVGVVMGSRPSLLVACTALGRLGAVSVIAPGRGAGDGAVRDAMLAERVRRVIVDPERCERAGALGIERLVLGGRRRDRDLPADVVDVEAITPSPDPRDLDLDSGRARDLAYVLLRPADGDGALRPAPVTNHRWALSALGAAATCAVRPGDTVFCAVSLHHPTGLLVSVGAALAGGARLALLDVERPLPGDARRTLLLELRRVGATVVFYAGEMLRPLCSLAPAAPADRHLPVRVFAGSGMRRDLAARLREIYGVDTMELYAGTTHRAILADPDAGEPGSLGTVLPGSAEVRLVACDLAERAPVRDPRGRLVPVGVDEPGLLVVRLAPEELDVPGGARAAVLDAFGDGSAWLVTSDVLRRDASGRHWFVDTLAGLVTTPSGEIASLRAVEDALYALPEVALAAAWDAGSGEIGAAFVATSAISSGRLDDAMAALPAHARPSSVARVAELSLTDGFRASRSAARVRSEAATDRWRRAEGGYVPGGGPS